MIAYDIILYNPANVDFIQMLTHIITYKCVLAFYPLVYGSKRVKDQRISALTNITTLSIQCYVQISNGCSTGNRNAVIADFHGSYCEISNSTFKHSRLRNESAMIHKSLSRINNKIVVFSLF